LLGDFPVNIAVHPSGALRGHPARGPRAARKSPLWISRRTPSASRVSIPETFYGIGFSKDGSRLFCSGAGDESVHQYSFADGDLFAHKEFTLRDKKEKGIPAGLAVGRRSDDVYVANVWGQRVTRLSTKSGKVHDIALTREAISQANPEIRRAQGRGLGRRNETRPGSAGRGSRGRSLSLCLRARRERGAPLRESLGAVTVP